MQKKIEITTEEPLEAEGAPNIGQDGNAPDFGDHINPRDAAMNTDTIVSEETAGAAASSPTTEESTEGVRGVETGAEDYITALQAELEEARTKTEEAEKRFLYLQSDYQNYRRRRDEEQLALQKYSNSELIKALLPVLDNFERALKAAEQTKNFDALIGGVSGTVKQLTTFLEKAGVKTIEAVGKEFNPNIHEAIGHAESEEYPANTVTEELQKGYIMHDRVLRPTLVKVSQG